jgi:hypothetical protein
VAIQGSRSNAYQFGNVVKTGVCAMPSKRFFRHVENPFAVPLSICAGRAGLSLDAFWVFWGHHKKFL